MTATQSATATSGATTTHIPIFAYLLRILASMRGERRRPPSVFNATCDGRQSYEQKVNKYDNIATTVRQHAQASTNVQTTPGGPDADSTVTSRGELIGKPPTGTGETT
jgi:hypothetical protein